MDPRDDDEGFKPEPIMIRPAKRSSAKPIIGFYAKSNGGKTYSALLLARGFVGPTGKIGMIETEAGRGEAYVDMPEFAPGYDVVSLRAPFSPARYGEAISAFERANYDALIIDSASHEWEGVGGVLDWAAKNQAAGKKSMLAWQQPKISHQRDFMLRMLQSPIPLVIVCMRAKFPMEEVTKGGKKEWARSSTLEPTQAEDILHELFIHGYFDADHKFCATRYTRPDLAEIIRDGELITKETGARLAAWARGETKYQAEAKAAVSKKLALKLGTETIAEFSTLGEWFQGLERELSTATPEKAGALYDANIDFFNKAMERAQKTNPDFLETINSVGRLMHQRINGQEQEKPNG